MIKIISPGTLKYRKFEVVESHSCRIAQHCEGGKVSRRENSAAYHKQRGSRLRCNQRQSQTMPCMLGASVLVSKAEAQQPVLFDGLGRERRGVRNKHGLTGSFP